LLSGRCFLVVGFWLLVSGRWGVVLELRVLELRVLGLRVQHQVEMASFCVQVLVFEFLCPKRACLEVVSGGAHATELT